jgi:hypothetical protein
MYDIEIYNGDINFAKGGFTLVRDEAKLVQSLVKILITPLRNASLRPNYGTYLGNVLGHAMPEFIYLTKISDSVKDSINYLISEQSKASQTQYVSPGERIRELLYVEVLRNSLDSRQLDVYVGVRAGSGNIIERQFVIAPGAFVSQRGQVTPSVGGGGY